MDSDWRRQVMWEAIRVEIRNLKKPANEHLTQTKCREYLFFVEKSAMIEFINKMIFIL